MSDTTKTPSTSLVLNNKVYDVAKDAVTIYLPALVTLYAGMAVLWEWAYTDKVVASAGLIITFLGVILKLSSNQYANQPTDYDGTLIINETDPEKDIMSLNVDRTYDELGEKKELILKVVNPLKDSSQ